MDHQKLVRETIDAAMAFHKRRIWQRFTNFDCFALRLPGREDLVLATVMGDAGEQFGLSLFRGPNAVDAFAELTSSEMPESSLVESMDTLGYSLDRFGDLEEDGQAFFREVGLHPKYGEQVPGFIVKPPHRVPRLPDEGDLSLLLTALKAAVVADKRKLLKPAEVDDASGVCVIAVEDDSPEPTVSVSRERLSRGSVVAKPDVFAASGVDLSGIGRADAQWLVGMPSMPFSIENDDRSMQLLLIADEASTMVLQAMPMFSDETRKAVEQLIVTFEKHGVPRSIVFTARALHDAVAGVLERPGVTCSYMPRHPKLAELTRDFLDHLGEGVPSFDEFMDKQPDDGESVPAPDDLAGWKHADLRLAERFADHLANGERPRSSRAIKRYFNDDDLEYFFETHGQRGVIMAYSSWCMLEYRPTKKSKTQAEMLLAEPLPPAQQALLRARLEAHPTVYRVTGQDPDAGAIDLEDVLVGGTVTVHDQLLSETIDNGLFLTARAFSAGDFHFMELAGPPLGPRMGMEAVAFLRDSKLEFTPEGLKRESHKLGWLWGWIDDWQADRMPPHSCNTDGDDLLFHTAAFSVDDPEAVRRALRQRKDIDYDQEAGEFVWWKATEKNSSMPGDFLTLGRIELVGDELVLTVNSAERFAKARKWVDKLPGVTFIDVSKREIDPSDMPPMDEQMDDDEPVEMPPEMAATIQQQITGHYMGWLDSPLPALGGRTPREACRTAAGRDEVTMMIRTMPDPMGDAPVHIPREAMLRELGLPVGAPLSTSSGAPGGAPFAPPVEIGRNKPCPCGSGRKYKKCCGRERS